MKTKSILLALSIILFTVSCSGIGPTIRSNFNPNIELGHYKTFSFFKPLDTDYSYESLVSQYLKEATITEMTNRGFVLAEQDADLLINFHSNVESKQYIHQIPSSHRVNYYSYRGRAYYDTWDGYELYVEDYKEGTLNIDLIDRLQNKMVWEGIAIGRLSEEELDNLQPKLQKTVAEIFTKFPLIIMQ